MRAQPEMQTREREENPERRIQREWRICKYKSVSIESTLSESYLISSITYKYQKWSFFMSPSKNSSSIKKQSRIEFTLKTRTIGISFLCYAVEQLYNWNFFSLFPVQCTHTTTQVARAHHRRTAASTFERWRHQYPQYIPSHPNLQLGNGRLQRSNYNTLAIPLYESAVISFRYQNKRVQTN